MDQVPVTYGPKYGYGVSEDYDPFHPFSAKIMAITISAISVQASAWRVFHPCTVSILSFPPNLNYKNSCTMAQSESLG